MLPEPQSIEFLLNLLNSSCDWLFDGLKRYHSEHPEVEDGFRRIDAAFSHIQYKMQDELCKLDYDTNMVQLEAEEVDTVFLFKAKWMLVILKLESDKPTLGPERSILLEDLVLNFDFHVRCFGVLDSQDIIPRIKNSELHDWCKTDGKDKEILEFLARFLQKRDKLFLECYERHCSSDSSRIIFTNRLSQLSKSANEQCLSSSETSREPFNAYILLQSTNLTT